MVRQRDHFHPEFIETLLVWKDIMVGALVLVLLLGGLPIVKLALEDVNDGPLNDWDRGWFMVTFSSVAISVFMYPVWIVAGCFRLLQRRATATIDYDCDPHLPFAILGPRVQASLTRHGAFVVWPFALTVNGVNMAILVQLCKWTIELQHHYNQAGRPYGPLVEGAVGTLAGLYTLHNVRGLWSMAGALTWTVTARLSSEPAKFKSWGGLSYAGAYFI